MPTRNIGQVFFLDRSHGWIISTDALNEDPDARFYFHSTEDGAITWRTDLIRRLTYNLKDDIFPWYISFVDSQHGWILWHRAMMNSTSDSLLATADGGRTWQRLPDPPGPGPIDFISVRDGWMIGRTEVFHGIPDYDNEELWVTHDGGMQCRALHVALPNAEQNQSASFSEVRFKNTLEGAFIARVQLFAQAPGDLSRALAFFTHDGGKTWHLSQIDDQSAYRIDASIVGTHAIWILSDFDTKIVEFRRGREIITPVFPTIALPLRNLSKPEFIDDLNAWVAYLGGRAGLDAHGQRLASGWLLATTDGGKTFQIITPVAATQSVPISVTPQ